MIPHTTNILLFLFIYNPLTMLSSSLPPTDNYYCFIFKIDESPLKKFDITCPNNVTYFRIDQLTIKTRFNIQYNESIVTHYKSLAINYTSESSKILNKFKKEPDFNNSNKITLISRYLRMIKTSKHPELFINKYEILEASNNNVYYPVYKDSITLNKTNADRTSNTRRQRGVFLNLGGYLINNKTSYTYTLQISLTKKNDDFEISSVNITHFKTWDFSFGHHFIHEDDALAVDTNHSLNILKMNYKTKTAEPYLFYILPKSSERIYHNMASMFIFGYLNKNDDIKTEEMEFFEKVFEFKHINEYKEEKSKETKTKNSDNNEKENNDDNKEEIKNKKDNNDNKENKDRNTINKPSDDLRRNNIKKLIFRISLVVVVLTIMLVCYIYFYRMKNNGELKMNGKYKRKAKLKLKLVKFDMEHNY